MGVVKLVIYVSLYNNKLLNSQHCTALSEMIAAVEESLLNEEKLIPEGTSGDVSDASTAKTLREILDNREKLLPDVGRTVRLGRLLRSRLKEPLHLQRSESIPIEKKKNI